MSLIYFENLIEQGLLTIVGNPAIIGGILFVLFFMMFFLLRLPADAMFVVAPPIFLLLSFYIPGLFLIFAFTVGVVIAMFFLKIVRR